MPCTHANATVCACMLCFRDHMQCLHIIYNEGVWLVLKYSHSIMFL